LNRHHFVPDTRSEEVTFGRAEIKWRAQAVRIACDNLDLNLRKPARKNQEAAWRVRDSCHAA